MAQPRFYLVNAFANDAHSGNPAAVVLLPPQSRLANDESYCRALARDFGMPMTAIVTPVDTEAEEPVYASRWFTPIGKETPICGHAMLATSFVLFMRFHPAASTVHFQTRTLGATEARWSGSPPTASEASTPGEGRRGQGGAVTVSIPLGGPAAPSPASEAVQRTVAAATGLKANDIEQVAMYYNDTNAVVRLSSSVDLANLDVNISALPTTPGYKFTILTQLVDGQVRSRVFAPSVGISEDAVCGSGNSVLAQYYLHGHARDVYAAFTDDKIIRANQVSPRGGKFTVATEGDRAILTGRSWLWAEGTLTATEGAL